MEAGFFVETGFLYCLISEGDFVPLLCRIMSKNAIFSRRKRILCYILYDINIVQ